MMKFSKGQIPLATIGITAGVTFITSWLGGLIFNSPVLAAKALETAKTELTAVQIKDGNRITALETDMTTIKASQLRTEADIKDILKYVKQ